MSDGIGLRRLQHLVLWVSDVERSVRFYCDLLGFEVTKQHPNAAFLKIPGTPDDHHLGLFEQATGRPDERGPRMYHAAWEVGEITDLVRARRRLVEAGSLVGQSGPRGEPVALRQGSGRARVRGVLDGAGWPSRGDAGPRSRRRGGPLGHAQRLSQSHTQTSHADQGDEHAGHLGQGAHQAGRARAVSQGHRGGCPRLRA
jgi:Predicted ring-cleavage extradiol dioxygenase